MSEIMDFILFYFIYFAKILRICLQIFRDYVYVTWID